MADSGFSVVLEEFVRRCVREGVEAERRRIVDILRNVRTQRESGTRDEYGYESPGPQDAESMFQAIATAIEERCVCTDGAHNPNCPQA